MRVTAVLAATIAVVGTTSGFRPINGFESESLRNSLGNRSRFTFVPRVTRCASSGGVSAADLRVSYSNKGIDVQSMPGDPYDAFKEWFEEACAADVLEPNAMCLSTCKDNVPTARYVLLKGHDERGYVWYTNYNSNKAQDLIQNPRAALTFWWGDLERSVRVEGVVERVSEEESTKYFHSRPRGSQIGAWTSNQSSAIESREVLQQQEAEIIKRFEGTEVIPKPPHWGGFRLVPNKVEFWKGRESRIHDRIVYEKKEDSSWAVKRLQP
jgi:pyridoxamine 5'-phosphate oxidase